jgi:error-prone DNA polymerase
MALPRYIELRARSAFSFLAGASLPEELIERAAALGYPAIALGDRDGVYGAPRFHQAAKQAGMRALVGAELTFRHAASPPQGVVGLEGYGVRGKPQHPSTPNLFTSSLYLLVATRTGYRNLCRLLTQTKLRAKKGESFITWQDLEGVVGLRGYGVTEDDQPPTPTPLTPNRLEGLICLAGGLDGPLGQAVMGLGGYGIRGNNQQPLTSSFLTPNPLDQVVARLQRLFGSRLYIDVQRHLDPEEERFNRTLVDIARHYRIPLVATNDVHHATRTGRPPLDVLTPPDGCC